MTKIVKKGVAVVLLQIIMFCFLTPREALAVHLIPGGEGRLCNNTYFSYAHTGFSQSKTIPPHQLTDGRICTRTRLFYIHAKICSACGGCIEENVIFDCSESHSICTDPVPTCQ